MLYRLDISTFYFYESFAVSDFRPLEIYKKLGFPLSTITFTVNNHADNHFYNFFFNVIQCEFFIYFIYFFYIQSWIKCETPLVFFLIRTIVYRKKRFIEKNSFFAVDYVKIIELYIVHTWRHIQSE